MSQSVARTGRPSRYTAQLAAAICWGLVEGNSLRRLCSADEMPDRHTVFRWLDANDTFRLQYARARELQAHALADEALDISDDSSADRVATEDGERVDYEHIQRARLRVDTRKWMAGKLLPRVYGEKTLHTGADGQGPVEVRFALDYSRLDAEELITLRRLIAKATPGKVIEAEAEEE